MANSIQRLPVIEWQPPAPAVRPMTVSKATEPRTVVDVNAFLASAFAAVFLVCGGLAMSIYTMSPSTPQSSSISY